MVATQSVLKSIRVNKGKAHKSLNYRPSNFKDQFIRGISLVPTNSFGCWRNWNCLKTKKAQYMYMLSTTCIYNTHVLSYTCTIQYSAWHDQITIYLYMYIVQTRHRALTFWVWRASALTRESNYFFIVMQQFMAKLEYEYAQRSYWLIHVLVKHTCACIWIILTPWNKRKFH